MLTEINLNNIKKAWPKLACLSNEKRNQIIIEIADLIKNNINYILTANQKDINIGKQNKLTNTLLDRLSLNESRLNSMVESLYKIAKLPDPLNIENKTWTHKSGMLIQKIRVPIGLLLIVYEARPNVTTDTIGLVIKTGNAAILKGSRQTENTNIALSKYIKIVLEKYNLLECFGFFNTLDEKQSIELISNKNIDLIIPRGGEKLKEFVKKYAVASVLGAGGGLCHIYISDKADLQKAQQIIFNAKTQRPSVCNSVETVLIHKNLLDKNTIKTLFQPLLDHKVSIKADQELCNLNTNFELATELDWETEYLDLILAIKSVNSLEEATEHINKYSTRHSEAIITENETEAKIFCQIIDSACIYVNASTRFTDGEEFGFGAEIGISTQKLHARGPIGLTELTTYKYLILGQGQIRN